MGMVVRTNTMATNAYRSLASNQNAVAKSLEKLSSGFRINRAGDDASGLSISEKMKAQIKGLEQASANSQDGISLVQTAEGALTEVHSMLNRMVELATKSANGTIQTEVDRESIQTEVDALNTEITRISKSTNFNGINLLDGSLGGSDPVLTGGAKLDDTKATLGKTTAATLVVGGGAFSGTSTYKVEWTDKDGKFQTTSVTITGTGATTVTGGSGATYTAATSTPTIAEWGSFIKGELEANEDFNEAFNIVNTAGVLSFENKTLGSEGGKLVSLAISGGTNGATGGAIAVGSGTYAGVDAGKKLDLSGIKAAATGESAAEMAKKVFTIDGKKFLAVGNNVTTTEIAALDKDINVVKLTAANYAAANDAAAVKDAINRAFSNTEYSVATAANADAGIAANDIIFTSASKGLTLQVGDTNDAFNQVTVSVDNLSAEGLGINGLDVSSQTAAGDSIKTIKEAINKVSKNRGNLGALQNRLEHAINNLDTTAENMESANSRIRDTDMAKEMMNYTKQNILSQAAQAMLAQANQQPQAILQLLQ